MMQADDSAPGYIRCTFVISWLRVAPGPQSGGGGGRGEGEVVSSWSSALFPRQGSVLETMSAGRHQSQLPDVQSSMARSRPDAPAAADDHEGYPGSDSPIPWSIPQHGRPDPLGRGGGDTDANGKEVPQGGIYLHMALDQGQTAPGKGAWTLATEPVARLG